MNWIEAATVPEGIQMVIICVEGKYKRFVSMGRYIEAKTQVAEDFIDEDYWDDMSFYYDPDTDTNWAPQGWYELSHSSNDIECYFLGDKVTHWQPLPALP